MTRGVDFYDHQLCTPRFGPFWDLDQASPPRPEYGSVWYCPVPTPNDRAFEVLTILKVLLDRGAPQSGWPQRLNSLLVAHPAIPTRLMGFPEEWLNHGVWR